MSMYIYIYVYVYACVYEYVDVDVHKTDSGLGVHLDSPWFGLCTSHGQETSGIRNLLAELPSTSPTFLRASGS